MTAATVTDDVAATLNTGSLNYPTALNTVVIWTGSATMTAAAPVVQITLPLNNIAGLNHKAALNARSMLTGAASMTRSV